MPTNWNVSRRFYLCQNNAGLKRFKKPDFNLLSFLENTMVTNSAVMKFQRDNDIFQKKSKNQWQKVNFWNIRDFLKKFLNNWNPDTPLDKAKTVYTSVIGFESVFYKCCGGPHKSRINNFVQARKKTILDTAVD